MEPVPQLLTVAAAGRYVGLHRRIIKQAIEEGHIVPREVPGQALPRIRRVDLDRWVDSLPTVGEDPAAPAPRNTTVPDYRAAFAAKVEAYE